MSYHIFDHQYDIIVVGAGGAGLRATLGMVEHGLSTACITKVFPTHSNTSAAKGGISAALGSMEPDDWRWHWYDTIKSADWLGDQDAIEYLCREAKPAILELQQYGVPFLHTEAGKIYQYTMGGMTSNYGKGSIRRTCAAKNGAGPAILETLYQQCLKHQAKFFIEYFALDLIMDDDGACIGVMALNMKEGTLHRFTAQVVVLATGGYGRAYRFCTSDHTCTGDGNGMVLRAGLPLQDMEFVQFHPTGIYGSGKLIMEGARSEGGFLVNSYGERFMQHYAPKYKELASRDVISRAIMMEIQQGRGVGPQKDHVYLHLEHLGADVINKRLPFVVEAAKNFAGIDVTKEPIPVIPTVHYHMGGIPTNLNGEVITLDRDNKEQVVPGLMAVGECACVSVHGANRLGSNSLLDIIVFGRAAAMHCAKTLKPNAEPKQLPANASEHTLSRLNFLRYANGNSSTDEIYSNMQQVMHDYAGVFRTMSLLETGKTKIGEVFNRFSDIKVKNSLLSENPELIKTLELDNLRGQAVITIQAALNRPESRGVHACEDFPNRDDQHWMKHSLIWIDEQGNTTMKYRPVHFYTLTDEIEAIPPQARVY
jgi:succinate dehydrogenase flavoprotein subunit